MKVFKFGGASVKDAKAVRNLVGIVSPFKGSDLLIVVSAMGKTTNALEDVISNYLYAPSKLQASLLDVKQYHERIIAELFLDTNHPVFNQFNISYTSLLQFLKTNTVTDYDFVYDQIIGYGELFSTILVSHFLNQEQVKNRWLDVRDYIKTDANYRRASVDWDVTKRLTQPLLERPEILITQGFLGCDSNQFTTTLGREGSDYTAAIFASCLQAEAVTIWKDVPGVLNADPRYFNETQMLASMSYNEAIELAFYGASVIHPKTLQPLQRESIPLFVKSFLNPSADGTKVDRSFGISPHIPCYIVKKNQILIKLSSLDFSYIVEENISDIFKILHLFKMKVDLIQNSAISFSVCIEDNYHTLNDVVKHLEVKFKVRYLTNVSLYTVRHYTTEAIDLIEKDKDIVLKQRTQDTLQIVTK